MDQNLEATVLSLQAELQQANYERENLNRHIEAQNSDTETRLRREIADLQEINRGLELQICQLPQLAQGDDFERLQNDNIMLRADNDKLEKKQIEYEEQLKENEAKISTLLSENEQMKQEISILKHDREEQSILTQQINELLADNLEKESHLAVLNDQIQDYVKQVDEYEQQIKNQQLQIQLAAQNQANIQKQTRRDVERELEAEKQQLNELVAYQAGNIEQLQAELLETRNQLTISGDENEHYKSVVQGQSDEIFNLKQHVKELDDKLELAKKAEAKAEETIKSNREQIQILKLEGQEFQSNGGRYKARAEELEVQLQKMKMEVSALGASNAELNKQNELLNKRITLAQQDNKNLIEKMNSTKSARE